MTCDVSPMTPPTSPPTVPLPGSLPPESSTPAASSPDASAPENETARLRAAILGFALDDPAAAPPFSARLARENDWSHAFARRVADEYRRFLVLAATSGREVTPSEEVDAAWHLHMLYSRSYWTDFCGGVLGRPLHHEPTRGGSTERSRFDDDYRATLELYRESFGAEAPADIWPAPEVRFGPVRRIAVDPQRYWIIPKPAMPRRAALGLALITVGLGFSLGLLALVSNAGAAQGTVQRASMLPVYLLGGTVATAFAGHLLWERISSAVRERDAQGRKKRKDEGGDSGGSSSCSSDSSDSSDSGWSFWGSSDSSSSDSSSSDSSSDSGCGSGCGGGD